MCGRRGHTNPQQQILSSENVFEKRTGMSDGQMARRTDGLFLAITLAVT